MYPKMTAIFHYHFSPGLQGAVICRQWQWSRRQQCCPR